MEYRLAVRLTQFNGEKEEEGVPPNVATPSCPTVQYSFEMGRAGELEDQTIGDPLYIKLNFVVPVNWSDAPSSQSHSQRIPIRGCEHHAGRIGRRDSKDAQGF